MLTEISVLLAAGGLTINLSSYSVFDSSLRYPPICCLKCRITCLRVCICSSQLENAAERGPEGEEKEWTDCVADDLRLFGITGDWSTAALDPGTWYSTQYTKGAVGLWPRG